MALFASQGFTQHVTPRLSLHILQSRAFYLSAAAPRGGAQRLLNAATASGMTAIPLRQRLMQVRASAKEPPASTTQKCPASLHDKFAATQMTPVFYENQKSFVKSAPQDQQVCCFLNNDEILLKQKSGDLLKGDAAQLNRGIFEEVLNRKDPATQTLIRNGQIKLEFRETHLTTGLAWANTPVSYSWADSQTLHVQSPVITIPAWLKLGDCRKNIRLISPQAAERLIDVLLATVAYSANIADNTIKCHAAQNAVQQTTQKIAGLNTDIYVPVHQQNLPVVVFMQGAGVAKESYSDFATRFASRGYAVLIPEHAPAIAGQTLTCLSMAQPSTFEKMWQAVQKGDIQTSNGHPLKSDQLYGMGHSYGGLQLTTLLSDKNLQPLFTQPGQLPSETRGMLLFGVNNKIGFLPAGTLHLGPMSTLVLQGEKDRISKPENTLHMIQCADASDLSATFFDDIHHYGITNDDGNSAFRKDQQLHRPYAKAVVMDTMLDEIERFINPGVALKSSDNQPALPVGINMRIQRC